MLLATKIAVESEAGGLRVGVAIVEIDEVFLAGVSGSLLGAVCCSERGENVEVAEVVVATVGIGSSKRDSGVFVVDPCVDVGDDANLGTREIWTLSGTKNSKHRSGAEYP